MTPDPVRIAIFGNGFARTTILPCLRHVEGVTLAGIASPTIDRTRQTAREFGIEAAAADHREILDRARPDLVFIVTPPHRHLEQTRDALAAGCHVVCEKPTAMSREESAAMLGAAESAPGRLALLDHELRFDPRRRALEELVAEGALGTIYHASYTLLSSGRQDPGRPWSWWSDAAAGGGAWGAIGSHAVDTLRVYLGEVESVRGRLETFVKERPDPARGKPRPVTADDYAAAWIRFRSGTAATITISVVEGSRRHEFSLAGSRGAACWAEQGPLLLSVGGKGWQPMDVIDDLPDSAALGIPSSDWARSFLRYAREIVAAIRAGGTAVPGAAAFTDGHRNQEVLDSVRRSAATEGWVSVDVSDRD